MDIDEFRREAHAAVDWMADYLRDVGERRVVTDAQPGDIRRRLSAVPPEHPEPFGRVMADFKELIVPGMTHWNHPGWFAYFPANNSPPSILAEMLTATMGAQCMSWQTSPAATELEQVVMDWLRQLVGLPDAFHGVIQDTASTSTLVALLTARERATAFAFGRAGAGAEGASKLTVYTSREGHSSIVKGVKLAGYGTDNLRLIDSDAAFAMRPDALAAAMEADARAGRVPACVVATVGTTSSAGIDPLPAICDIAARYHAWVHVDGAYGGSAAVVPEKRELFGGLERADSFVFNPHKWLFTNFDCSAYFVRDVEALLHTFQASAEYLKTAHDERVVNFRDWGIQLGRRFRALKLWFVLRTYGAEGLRARVREHLRLAQVFRGWVAASSEFELLAPTHLALVCFRARPSSGSRSEADLDSLNEKLLVEINRSGRVYLTHTRLNGRYTLRMSIGQTSTDESHVRTVWELAQAALEALT
jgi:aromatic-L-amino-acid decarboxylase